MKLRQGGGWYNGFSPQQRDRAFAWYKVQLATGRLPRPRVCMACGTRKGVMGHSEDYSAPYGPHVGAFHLCRSCHMTVHGRFAWPRRFEAYVSDLEGRPRRKSDAHDPGILRLIAAGAFLPRR